uniref:Uncharacterized protein n=1 Tax=Parascaris univalens TaxID=6257 RepID=A0A915AAZ3_PARUN
MITTWSFTNVPLIPRFCYPTRHAPSLPRRLTFHFLCAEIVLFFR